jgi:hypothetical protein
VGIEDEELHGWLDLPSLIGVAILRAAPPQGKCVPQICNVNAVITCPHQTGIVKPLPRQTKVMVGGALALRITDMAGSPVAGCPAAGPGIKPCTTVPAPAAPGATKVLIGGLPAMLATSTMTSDSTPPVPSATLVKFAGQTTVNAL